MELKIGICDSDVGWHRRMEEILGKAECITRISREMEHFYGEKELLLYTGDSIDLLFMDVKLKDGNGITLAGQINGIWPECQIIFVAEDLSSAVDAYETDHAYYILKDQAADLIERVLLAANEIIYFERRKRVTVVRTTVGTYEVRDRLDVLEKVLFPEEFVRCHTSYIVYLPAVRAVEGNSFLMQDGSWVPISRGYQKTVKRYVNVWLRTHAMAVRNAENDRKRAEYAQLRNVLSEYCIVVSLSYYIITKYK